MEVKSRVRNPFPEEGEKSDEERARSFYEIASGVFAPLYPVLAGQILERRAKNLGLRDYSDLEGSCLDLGSAAGHLGIALARKSKFRVHLCDISPAALALSEELLKDDPIKERVSLVESDVHFLPLEDASFDLVISRGSLWFWEDQSRALKEIWRVLKPGGFSYVGGGFATSQIKEQIAREMDKRNQGTWAERQKKIRGTNTAGALKDLLETLGYPYELLDDASGLWIILKK